jgi:hypothetical protein
VALQIFGIGLQQGAIAREEHHPLTELDQHQQQPVHAHRSGIAVRGGHLMIGDEHQVTPVAGRAPLACQPHVEFAGSR